MRKKRIMVIGPKGCGKTTLVNSINDYDGPLRRTQDTIYGRETIDVPSAYIENAWMYKHMIALAQDAWCILLHRSVQNGRGLFPRICPRISLSGS